MRHIISVLLQNEAGALSRVTNLFSTRGFNIESLNVAPTNDETLSRLTVVSTGSEAVIDQISKHLGKLVDVVKIVDMTGTDHIERELALFKLRLPKGGKQEEQLADVVEAFGGHILDDSGGHFTVALISGGSEIDRFLVKVAEVAEVETLVRSGAMAVTKGAPISTTG
ncbi:MAG: acetolactate synthase small subunit [Longimicrobiales bacterium]